MGINILVGHVAIGQGVKVLNQKRVNLGQMHEEVFHNEDDKTLEQVAQKGGLCPIPKNIHGQARQCSEQPD